MDDAHDTETLPTPEADADGASSNGTATQDPAWLEVCGEEPQLERGALHVSVVVSIAPPPPPEFEEYDEAADEGEDEDDSEGGNGGGDKQESKRARRGASGFSEKTREFFRSFVH